MAYSTRAKPSGSDPSLAIEPFGPVLYRFEATLGTDVLLPSGPVPAADLPISLASGAPVQITGGPGVVLAVFDADSKLQIASAEGLLELTSLPDGSYILAASANAGGAGAAPGLRIAPSKTTLLASIDFVGAVTLNNVQFDPGVIEYIPFSVGSGPAVADVTTTGATLQGQLGFGEPDGTVDLDDLGYFLNFWILATP